MEAVELSTKISASGEVVIPRAYTKDIPAGSEVRVLILWEELTDSQQPNANTPAADDEALNAFVARIKSRPLTPAYAPLPGKIRAEDWTDPSSEDAEIFDPEQWNHAWDKIECTMEAEEDAAQDKTVCEIASTLFPCFFHPCLQMFIQHANI